MTTILVTGANRGIGLELVKALLNNGNAVVATARQPDAASALMDLKKTRPGLEIEALNVTDEQSIARLAAKFGERPLDGLINNAGIIGPDDQSTLNMDFRGWMDTFATNTVAPLQITQALMPALRRAPQARILTISSLMGSMSHSKSDRIAYRSSKTAVNKVMQALAGDVREFNITVACAHPGWVQTDMGGANADITPAQSGTGLIEVFEALTIEKTGTFFNYDGTILPW